MRWRQHSHLEGSHAFLSPSSYHWINYDVKRLAERWSTARATILGVVQHAFACEEIMARRLQEDESTLVGMYINDCVREGMTPEQILYYSDNCFGTADAIKYWRRILRVWDLKTGATRASVRQLEVYGALFCLEYSMDPYDMRFEFRIYQDGPTVPQIYDGDPAEILRIMNQIITFDKVVRRLKRQEERRIRAGCQ